MAELDLSRYSSTPLFNTKAVVQETGVSAATLRAWERRYGVPDPDRTGSNYRLYSERDIALIRWLTQRVEAGLSISQAVELYRRMEDGENIVMSMPNAGQNENRNPAIPSYEESRRRLTEAFMRFDEREADRLLNELFALYTIEDVLSDIVQPVMVEIGELWHSGEIGVPQEHFASAYMERKVMSLINAQPAHHDAPLVVSGCAPHEQHELGILLFSLFLRRTGLRVLYLGQNVPLVDLQAALETLKPAMITLSATTDEAALELGPVSEMVAEMPHPRPIFAYGGLAFTMNPALADTIVNGVYLGGEDAQNAARSALKHIRRHTYDAKGDS